MNLNNSVRVRGGNGGEKLTLSRVRGIGFLEIIVGIRKTIKILVVGGRKASCQGWSYVNYQARVPERQKAKERGERTLCQRSGKRPE